MSLATALRKQFNQGPGTLVAGSHIGQLSAGRSLTGITVTTDKALSYAPFWAAVRVLAESVAMLPLSIHRLTPDGRRGVAHDSRVQRLVHDHAGPRLTSFAWRELLMTHLLTWGNAYALIVRDGTGAIRQLWPLAPDRMAEPERDSATGEIVYSYTLRNGTTFPLPEAAVFHIPGLSWDGVRGYSVIRLAREDIGLGLAAREYGARFFAQDAGGASVVLRHPKTLSDPARANIASSWRAKHQGLSTAWEPAILEEGMSLDRLALPPGDAQFIETRKFGVAEIARWFRLTPHLLGDLDRATFSNIEELGREFVDYTLLPWLTRIESAIGLQLLDDDWTGNGGQLYARFNVAGLLRGQLEARYRSYATGIQWGFLSANKVAELEDWDPVPGGDEYLRPLNMTTVNPDGGVTTTTMTVRKDGAGPLRCSGCDRLLAEEISPPYRLACSRCSLVTAAT